MLPILFTIPLLGGIPIYTYGVLVAIGFLVGISWTGHEAKKAGVNPDFIIDLAFYVVVAGIVGSRILYILVGWEHYLASPLEIFMIWKGGLVFYGGLIGAILMTWFYSRYKKQRFLLSADLLIPGVALGHVFGRLGCFAAGCCYGKPVLGAPFWALRFPEITTTLAPTGIDLYPSQLMESASNLVLFILLVLIRKRKKFEGQIILSYVVLYGVARSTLELFRGDKIRGFVIADILSTSQTISLLMILGALVLYWKLWKQKDNIL
ncbi:MAG: prolipoprotein diacylglyceryl transferase [bacterium]|nr:prolipoprotein diacylglyceryl transferase [bacterium]